MKIENSFDLSKLTTIGLGGTAKVLYTPESVEELKNTIAQTKCEKFIGGGRIY